MDSFPLIGGVIEPAIAVQQVSDNFFRTLGLRMAIGTSESSAPGAVISYRFWKRRFGGGSNVLGETFDVNGSSYSVIGVAPASFLGVQVEVRLFVNPEIFNQFSAARQVEFEEKMARIRDAGR